MKRKYIYFTFAIITITVNLIGCSRAPSKVVVADLISSPSSFYGKIVEVSGEIENCQVVGGNFFAPNAYVVCQLGDQNASVQVIMTRDLIDANQNLDLRDGRTLTLSGKFQERVKPDNSNEEYSNAIQVMAILKGLNEISE